MSGALASGVIQLLVEFGLVRPRAEDDRRGRHPSRDDA
ncbi:hypothetical protein EV667_1107 [Ancylobacter aquaticus]|uniref:Uncharacterized protein n=1 Tax=Ancylobacter aquaticus TaxID=100 RepID=A0A4R1IHI1_ANCAQ|nr:hypothetical protein EV667_1107 [Ancylobacter aquaticus]